MQLRKYTFADCEKIAELFYHTVHTVNAADYTQEQLNAWASGTVDLDRWHRSFVDHKTLVATDQGVLTGFGDITDSGYIDRLYVHKDYQGRGIGSAICSELEKLVQTNRFTVHASITAKPFFEKKGYHVVEKQIVQRKGIFLTNYAME